MNLVKIADMLKNATDQSLAQEIQNPTGSVPSYMVLSELERRKKLRSSLMNNEPQQSVAEEASAEFGGLGALRNQTQAQAQETPYTSQEDAAQGYAQGGEVVHARSGWFGEDIGDTQEEPYAESSNAYGLSDLGADLQKPYGYKQMFNIKPAFTGEQETQRRQLISSGVSPENASRMVRGEPVMNTPSGKAVNASANPAAAPAAPSAGPAGPGKQRSTNLYNNPVSTTAAPAANVAGGFDPMGTLSEAYKEGMAGIGQYNDYLKQAIAENKAQKAENAWQAMTMAGLGMLGGRSQFAAENIGQGAMMGMQQFTGAEQSRQKEGRALAMDMASAGLKSSEIKSRLADAGFKGKYYQGLGEKAEAEAKIGIPATADYHRQMGAAAGVRASGAGKMDPQVRAQAAAYESHIDNLQAQLKNEWDPAKKKAIIGQINDATAKKAKLLGIDLGGGAAPAPAGGGNWSMGQNGRMVFTP